MKQQLLAKGVKFVQKKLASVDDVLIFDKFINIKENFSSPKKATQSWSTAVASTVVSWLATTQAT